MKNKEKDIKNLKEIEEKLSSQRKDFEKIMEDIKPFIKESELFFVSTTGNWRDGNSPLELQRTQNRPARKS